MLNFVAIVTKEPKSCYGVEFPDVPGCFSAGDTLEEALANAQEALGGHLALLVKEGDALPKGSTVDAIHRNKKYAHAAALLVVSVPHPKPRAIRVNITIPEDLAEEASRFARAHRMSRSAFLAQAAIGAMRQS